MKRYTHKPQGVCSAHIVFHVDGDIVRNVSFDGGCHGNTQGITRLVEGMKVDEVIRRLRGISCGGKGTSCPDQLAQGLEALVAKRPTRSRRSAGKAP